MLDAPGQGRRHKAGRLRARRPSVTPCPHSETPWGLEEHSGVQVQAPKPAPSGRLKGVAAGGWPQNLATGVAAEDAFQPPCQHFLCPDPRGHSSQAATRRHTPPHVTTRCHTPGVRARCSPWQLPCSRSSSGQGLSGAGMSL